MAGQHEPLPSSHRLSRDGVGQGLSWSPQGLFSLVPGKGPKMGSKAGKDAFPLRSRGACRSAVWPGEGSL